MKKRFTTIKKPNLLLVYALMAVAFITCFQLYWLYSVYNNQKSLISEETENMLKEYALDYDGMSIMGNINGNGAILAPEMRHLPPDSLTEGISIQVKLSGDAEHGMLRDSIQKTLDSILSLKGSGKLDSVLYNKFKSRLSAAYPNLEYGLSYNIGDKKTSFPNPMPNTADALIVVKTSQINPFNQFRLILFNLESVVFQNMVWDIVLSIVYLIVCISAVVLLINSTKKSRKLLEMKDNFTNNMTHEIKTPLATLYAATEALDKYDMLDDKVAAREYIHIMQADLKRLTEMAESILYNAKLSDGRINLKKENINIKQMLADIAGKFKPSTEALNAVINTDSIPDDMYIKADAEHLYNVFCNLVDNSLKYSEGNAQIYFSAREEGEKVKIWVEDNGVGIAEAHHKDIFKPYFRVSEGDVHTVKGYGLGLSYAYEIIALHKGVLKLLKSQPGKGTTFEITLPQDQDNG
ncbi:HAMP domain-containing histidine kinase [Flavobacterium zepuense]|uniref:histidine kinase n=1 Tax=Flavobacterium zepuense TaxID=2593302 RepID=A0A552UZB9_9FLAO|nr:HAMP domain-containing sensor histidine kinase [Flavobacterium zepuense]TRW23558.1 HAMP domain-containing histidine kinase [Flavobacterium zepuense]